jgi:hypothetical protein
MMGVLMLGKLKYLYKTLPFHGIPSDESMLHKLDKKRLNVDGVHGEKLSFDALWPIL